VPENDGNEVFFLISLLYMVKFSPNNSLSLHISLL